MQLAKNWILPSFKVCCVSLIFFLPAIAKAAPQAVLLMLHEKTLLGHMERRNHINKLQ